jgi:predicted dehydrogenase
LLNQGLHALDILLWTVGAPKWVFGVAARRSLAIDTDDNVAAVMEFPDGFPGTVKASVTAYPRNLLEGLSVVGDRGSVIIGGANLNHILTWEFVDGPPAPKDVTTAGHLGFYKRLAAQCDGSGIERPDAGGEGGSPSEALLPTVSDARLSVTVACAIYDSALLGQRVSVTANRTPGGSCVGPRT